jgi:hypothetical protein
MALGSGRKPESRSTIQRFALERISFLFYHRFMLRTLTQASRHRRATPLCLAASLFALGACGPDTEARWNEYLDETNDAREAAAAAGSCEGDACAACDISGYHLVGLETLLGPGVPIQFMTEVISDGDTATFSFQPLSLDMGSTDSPREEVGDAIVVSDVPIVDGTFIIDFGEVTVTGEANPISGGDIVATIVLEGRILSADAWAGTVTGMATSPVSADLVGSTFGAYRVSDPSERPAFPCDSSSGEKVCYTTCGLLSEYIDAMSGG